MFKAGRWRSEKNMIKAVFKLQFQATQVPQLGWDTLMVSLVPLEVGKPTVKLEKATVHDGVCQWENPIYETVRLNQDPQTGKINEKIYQFLVINGSSKASLLGEVTIDFAEYAESIKPSTVSLPFKTSNLCAILHVTIQRIQIAVDGRELEENDTFPSHSRTPQSQLKNYSTDGSCKASNGTKNFNSNGDGSSITGQAQFSLTHKKISQDSDSNGVLRTSTYGDAISASSFDSSSGQDTPKEDRSKNNNVENFGEHQRSNTEWSVSSAPDESIDGSTNSSENIIPKETSQASDISIEKLKNEVIILERQVEVSEVELQTLRKQIVKESKKGQDLSREVCCLKEERDAFRRECERFKASRQSVGGAKVSNTLQFDNEDKRYMFEEMKQELNYEKDLNANLRLQLHKTQESNSELILAVRELEELLEQKDNSQEMKFGIVGSHLSRSTSNQEVWEELSEHEIEDRVAYSLEQKIFDLCSEIEVYKKDREELEMQMDQLALDYEILKQENHDMSSKLEQSQLQEQLMMQYECSASLAMINELEIHVENLEKELEKQSKAFESDLNDITCAKVEQEKRAIRAEESLRKIKWKNANIAERLNEQFKRLSMQMSSTFDTNEKLAKQALQEARELHLEKNHLEELLEKSNEEVGLMKGRYDVKVEQLSDQIDLKTQEKDRLLLELEEKSKELENRKKSEEEMNKEHSNEIIILQNEIEILKREKSELSEQVEQKEKWRADMERMKKLVEEKEMMVQSVNMERDVLERKFASLSNEAEKSLKELNDIRCLMNEKEALVGILQADKETLRSQYNDLKHSLIEDELEKENLRKQVFNLRSDLRKKEGSLSIIEKKLKDSNVRVAVSHETTKPNLRNKKSVPPPHRSKETVNLQEKIKLLERDIKHKESALENSTHLFLEKEKDLCNRIQELEKEMGELNQNDPSFCEDKLQKDANVENENVNSVKSKDEVNITENILESELGAKAYIPHQNGVDGASIGSATGTNSQNELKITTVNASDQGESAELSSEMTLLRERNKSMESELKEMQERYSEISLKFAEVEGERQQLVMTIRNLKK
ncbi:uncharacterized protein LOC143857224 [Tasmannia lanceolata]|uniref:uncharacterized protein LOC143857224 n=1 Tax=Tasmannia lanceolata TaxID=3420 RepID=UPI0040630AF0